MTISFANLCDFLPELADYSYTLEELFGVTARYKVLATLPSHEARGLLYDLDDLIKGNLSTLQTMHPEDDVIKAYLNKYSLISDQYANWQVEDIIWFVSAYHLLTYGVLREKYSRFSS